jgi:ABC-type glycerol-3-phosphate transport system substrate-binding protein
VECAAVSAGSTNPRAAWEWLNFLSKHWIVNDSSEVYEISRSPSRRSVADSSGYWDLLPAKAVPAVRFALEHGSYDTVYFDRFGEINVAIAKSIVENADFVQAYEAAYAARPEDTPTPPQDNSPIVVATPLAPLPEGVTAIKYYFTAQNPNENNTLNTLIEQYNQQSTDTRVTLVTEFHGDPGNNWISSMASNFDCFTGGAPYWEGLDATQLLSLNTLMSSEPASFNNDYSQEMINQFSQEGNLYGLPATSQVMMMAYNADLLTQRGLPMPASDWTFDDFIGMASAVASTSDTDPSYGFLFSPYEEFLAIGQGTKWIDFESNPVKVDFNSPEMLEHLRWLSKLEQDRVLFNQESNWEEMNAIMSAGQLAFWIASSGDQATWFYGSGQEPQYKIGMAPLPQTPVNNPMASWSNDRGHYISAQAQDPRACWDWIKFLSEQPNLLAGVPARRSIAESPAWEAWVGKDVASAYRTALENIQPVDQIEIDPKIQPVLWPLNQWKSQVVLAALAGEELQPLLIAQQEKADHYIDCALSLDLSQSMDQLNEGILACLRQADPEGGW